MSEHSRSANLRLPVLLPPLTRFITSDARNLVENAAQKLGIEKLMWFDPYERLE
jgi:hypothetical protein